MEVREEHMEGGAGRSLSLLYSLGLAEVGMSCPLQAPQKFVYKTFILD